MACHNPIRNNVFHLEDGDPYCETGKKQHNQSLLRPCGEAELNKVGKKNHNSFLSSCTLEASQQIHVTLICQFKAAASAVDALSLQQKLVRISLSASAGAGFLSLVLLVKPSALSVIQ